MNKEPKDSAKIEALFPGEDTSEVTNDELTGFYSFAVACEGYSGIANSVFWPIILKALATQASFEHDDRTIPCHAATGVGDKYYCDVPLFGGWIDTSSLVLYSSALSVGIQFLVFISFGSVADHGPLRKLFMILFTVLTAITGMLIAGVYTKNLWWVAYLIYIFANVFFGAAHVFNYAWVPTLTRYESSVIKARYDPSVDDDKYHDIFDNVANDISSKGFYYGYFASFAQMIIAIGVSFFVDSKWFGLTSTYTLQLCIAGICAFQLFVTFAYTNRLMKVRPGPPLPPGENYVIFSLKNLWTTLRRARQLSHLFKFLIVWFIYSDAFSTLVNIAILFAQSELGAPQWILLSATAIFPIFAGLGIKFWLWFQERFGYTTKQMIFIQCALYSLIPLYGLLGFLVNGKQIFFGLNSYYELPLAAALHGFMLGATSSSCRVLFSELLPHGHESEFFGLYQITDKGSSWIGPLAVGLITNATGSLRYGFYFIFASFMVPLVIILFVDVPAGKAQAHAFHQRYHKHKIEI